MSSCNAIVKYFSNSDQSGGGRLKRFNVDKFCDRALLKFKNDTIANRVLDKKDGHKLENNRLYVSKLPPVSKHMFFVRNVPKWINLHYLEDYLAARFLTEIQKISYRLVSYHYSKKLFLFPHTCRYSKFAFLYYHCFEHI